MNKRSRFILILVVLAVCALFLRPSVKWYFGTPDEKLPLLKKWQTKMQMLLWTNLTLTL